MVKDMTKANTNKQISVAAAERAVADVEANSRPARRSLTRSMPKSIPSGVLSVVDEVIE
jgi:hypothetical protein